MKNYFIVAKAKYNMKIGHVLYAIGQTLPTEMDEKTYEFFKDAMVIESCTLIENKAEPETDNTDTENKEPDGTKEQQATQTQPRKPMPKIIPKKPTKTN